MFRILKTFSLLLLVGCVVLTVVPERACGQTIVTAYAPAAPVIGYVPERRGLFGLQTVYRPVVAAPVAVPVTTVVPAAPVTVARPVIVSQPVTVANPVMAAPPTTTYYAPTTTYYAPTTTYYAPTTTYYAPTAAVAPAPVTSVSVASPVVVSQPVTTRYAPAAPTVMAAPALPATGCGCSH